MRGQCSGSQDSVKCRFDTILAKYFIFMTQNSLFLFWEWRQFHYINCSEITRSGQHLTQSHSASTASLLDALAINLKCWSFCEYQCIFFLLNMMLFSLAGVGLLNATLWSGRFNFMLYRETYPVQNYYVSKF